MPAEELGKLFAGLHCKEQVFWLTAPASGWMLRSFTAKGRIVISATLADDEYNETEFPEETDLQKELVCFLQLLILLHCSLDGE